MKLCLPILFAALALQAQEPGRVDILELTDRLSYANALVWSKNDQLLASDVHNNQILKIESGSEPAIFLKEEGGVSGAAYDSKGNLYLCEARGRRVVRVGKGGKLEVVADSFEGKRLNAPDDIAIRKDGHIYFTDPAFGSQADTRELDFNGVYHVSPKGDIERVAAFQSRPNGIALSTDGKTLWVANSDERKIYAWDLDGKGAASNQRTVISGIDGPPDGIAVDKDGFIYVAANQLDVYSPNGERVRKVEFARPPRSLAFGDEDQLSLFVGAYNNVYRLRFEKKGPVQH